MDALIEEIRSTGFGLGGSRRMAEKYPAQIMVGADTDWDFYCEQSEDKVAFLCARGFAKIEAANRNYWDDLLVDIYKHSDFPIEVLIRRDIDVYRSAFEALSAEVFIDKLWKSSPKADPDKCKSKFRNEVCSYFNGLFRLHGFKEVHREMTPDEIPF